MAQDDNLKQMQNKLKEIREGEQQKSINDYRMQIMKDRAAARAAEEDELRKDKGFFNEKGHEITYWEDAIHKADAAMGADVTTFNDWRNAMMSLLNMLSPLNKAINHSMRERILTPIGNKFLNVAYMGVDALNPRLKTREVNLPELRHLVEYTDNNTLKVDKLIRADKNSDISVLDDLFKKGIKNWLNDNGWKMHPEDASAGDSVQNPRFVDANGTLLDKNTFIALKNDQRHGLDAYLRANSDLSFSPQSPRP